MGSAVSAATGGGGGGLIPGIGGGIPGTGPGLPGIGGGFGGLPGIGTIMGGQGIPGMQDIMGGIPGLNGVSPGLDMYANYQNKLGEAREGRINRADDKLMAQFGGHMPDIGNRSAMLSGGRLTGDAYLDPNAYRGNTGALNVLNQKATATGNSPWLNMQLQKQGMEQQQAMGKMGAQANAANAQARAGLAMKGGLSGGAAERLARGGSQDLNAARQGVMNQGSNQRLQLGIQDESNKNQLLGQAVGANQAQNAQNIGIGQFNAQNTLAENNANNAFQMSKYQEQMKAFGAGKSANAMANSGKK